MIADAHKRFGRIDVLVNNAGIRAPYNFGDYTRAQFDAVVGVNIATPFFAAEYSLGRPGFPDNRVEFNYYQSGHMMYVHDSDRTKLSNDIRAFIRRQK